MPTNEQINTKELSASLLSAGANFYRAYDMYAESKQKAKRLRQQAVQTSVTGYQEASLTARRGRITQSDNIARIAASGGSVSDAGSLEALSRLDQDIAYNIGNTLRVSKINTNNSLIEADIVRTEGKIGATSKVSTSLQNVKKTLDTIRTRGGGYSL